MAAALPASPTQHLARHSFGSAGFNDQFLLEEDAVRSCSKAELDGIQAALGEVDDAKKLVDREGLSQKAFFVGIVNVVAITALAAKWPAYLCVLYAMESLVIIPAWFVRMSRLYSGALFVLDFCWVINITFGQYMLLSLLGVLPQCLHRGAFLIFFSNALGPLSWACLLLHNGLILHSIEKAASLFIHFTPTLVAWTLVWYPDEVAAAWPGVFPTARELREVQMPEVYLYGLASYAVWLILHAMWLLSVGIHCPETGHNTVFSDLYSKHDLGGHFSRATHLEGLRSHAVLYLALHFGLTSASFLWAALCFKFVAVHMVWIATMFFAAAWNGAGYYEYVFAKKHTLLLKGMMAEKNLI